MGDAERIRRLAARKIAPEAIAARLKLRPALVRRVLARSAQRGAPRTRGVSTTLSFATTPETAAQLRARAAEREVSLSSLIDETVREALEKAELSEAPSASRRSSRQPSGAAKPRLLATTTPRAARRVPVTAADAPESVVRLLKSFDPEKLRWRVRNDRHEIIVAILTRGNEEAREWLWSVLSKERVRELVRTYRGAGCAEPDRAKLREQLELTTTDIPTRAYLGMEHGDERRDP